METAQFQIQKTKPVGDLQVAPLAGCRSPKGATVVGAGGGSLLERWQPRVALLLFLFSVTSSLTIPPATNLVPGFQQHSQRGGFLLKRGRLGPSCLQKHLPCSWCPLSNQLLEKEQQEASQSLQSNRKLYPHPCVSLSKSQSWQCTWEIKECVFVVARFTGTAEVIHFI